MLFNFSAESLRKILSLFHLNTMIKIHFFILIGVFSLSQSKNRFMPNLPLGKYRMAFSKIYHCETTKNQLFQFNLYHSKKTSNITEMKGNITTLINYDDTLTLDINFSSWGSTGGWVPNALIFNTKEACSKAKILLGNAWLTIMRGFNVSTVGCPVPAGTYITSGIDLTKFEDNNFPKVYFYGKYKVVFRFISKENKEVACEVMEIHFNRPWETAT
ncbi:uncharacterized protein LOC111029653 [Myzus persicae]|uniref:uncharacterized protein LOC111029653 n=1 Tax=Myzus persicae TaxID=13164 RepID=UPI000B931E31|nr:uncharacterized protein LOC111029653 [Myzus persicae]